MPLYPARAQAFVNLGDYCKIDGSDDSTGFTYAYALASSLGMSLWHPGGTLVKGNDTLLSNVVIFGAGAGVAIIKLKNAANVDLFSANTGSINLSASAGSGSNTGVHDFGFSNVTLDGNKANQSSGTSYCLRFYGYGLALENVHIKNGYTGGVLCDWNGSTPTTGLESHCSNVKIHDNNGIGWQTGGPHDNLWINSVSYSNGTHNVHIAPNAQNQKFTNCRFYNPGSGKLALLIEANQCSFSNCEASGSDTLQVAVIASQFSWFGGMVYANPAGNVRGFWLGQSGGNAPFSGQIKQSGGLTTSIQCDKSMIQTSIFDCQSGAFSEQNVGQNMLVGRVHQSSGTGIDGGGLYQTTAAWIYISGLTPDGTQGTGGVMQLGRLYSYSVLDTPASDNHSMVSYDTYDGIVSLFNGNRFYGFANNGGGTPRFALYANEGDIELQGYISVGQSSSTPDPGNSGTIATADIGVARVTPTANRTGIILQTGSIGGQKCTIHNNSASFTITFAASGTSHVAQGANLTIAALGKYDFSWDSVAALWY